MWGSVRRGEEENIFPFQEGADTFFNSASIYELSALKQYAEPLLYEIREDEPEYYEAKRLLKFSEWSSWRLRLLCGHPLPYVAKVCRLWWESGYGRQYSRL